MLTPQIKADKLAKKIGLKVDLYLKREDLHPLGSHKGRSLPLMINNYAAEGIKNFVISSSGNAALAAALHIKELNRLKHFSDYALTILVGKKIEKNKMAELEKLAEKNIKIIKTTNPKQQALQMEKSGRGKNLRQSTDDEALVGYYELARELCEIKKLSAVFIPTSSGTTAEGLYEGFKKIGIHPQIHIVQTTACHPIVDILPKDSSSHPRSSLGMTSMATAIVDKVAHRKNQLAEAIKNSHGQGWIATNEEIQNAIDILQVTE